MRIAQTPNEALKAFAAFRPQVVLLDIGIPGMSGHSIATRMRQDHEIPLKLIAVTGYGHAEAVKQSKAAGFDHHLLKPADLLLLRRLIEDPVDEGGAHVVCDG